MPTLGGRKTELYLEALASLGDRLQVPVSWEPSRS